MTRSRPIRTAGWGLCLVLLLVCGSAAAADGRLHLGHWRGSAFGRAVTGNFLLLTDPEGFLRLELSRTEQALDEAALRSLLAWTGDGWCVVQGDPGEGTVGPWNDKWDRLDRSVGIWLVLAAAHLNQTDMDPTELTAWGIEARSVGAAPQPRPRFRTTGPSAERFRYRMPEVARLQAASPAETAPRLGFRAAQLQRAAGHGSAGEILTLERHRSADGRLSRLVLRASRKPGDLRLDQLSERPVRYDVNEVFVPLWPLADVLALEPEEIGNPALR